MTRNPYAHPIEESNQPEQPQRVSGLAVGSLVFGLLCCIPGSGLIGAILGGAALVRIGGARGRLSGRGLAFTGLILGVLGTVIYIALAIGVMGVLNGITVYGKTVGDIQNKNYAAVRAMLDPATSAAVSDARIDEFAAQITDVRGVYQGTPKGLGGWISSYMEVGPDIQSAQTQAGTPQSRTIPMPLKFDRGTGVGLFIIDPSSTGPTGAARLEDLAVLDKNGKLIWLKGSLTPPQQPAPTTPATPPSEGRNGESSGTGGEGAGATDGGGGGGGT
jgi:hypothetical protein